MYQKEFVKYDKKEKCNIYRLKSYVLFKVYDDGLWEVKTSGEYCYGKTEEELKEFTNLLHEIYKDNFKGKDV